MKSFDASTSPICSNSKLFLYTQSHAKALRTIYGSRIKFRETAAEAKRGHSTDYKLEEAAHQPNEPPKLIPQHFISLHSFQRIR